MPDTWPYLLIIAVLLIEKWLTAKATARERQGLLDRIQAASLSEYKAYSEPRKKKPEEKDRPPKRPISVELEPQVPLATAQEAERGLMGE